MAKPIKINFEGVEDRSFEPWPEDGPIEFTIFEIEAAKGKESGEPYLKFTFKQAGSNRRAWRNFSLQKQSLWVLKKLLVGLGVPKEDLEGDFEFDPDDVLGQTVYIKFGTKPGQDGKPRQEPISVSAEADDE